jgi:hypothetical protein
MYILLYQLIFKHRPPSLRPSQYYAASINTPVEIRRRRRKSQTSEKYYQIRCSLILYLYLQIWHNSAVTNSRRFSTARIAHISLRTLYEGSFALPYKDLVRSGPDTPLPRTRRRAVVLFVCPQLDRFASYPPTSKCCRKITLMTYQHNASGDRVTAHACKSVPPQIGETPPVVVSPPVVV